MVNYLNSLILLFQNQKSHKAIDVITPTLFKQLDSNQIQNLIFVSLKKIGLKPNLVQNLLPTKTKDFATVDEVFTNSGCKVNCTIDFTFDDNQNLALSIYIWGTKNTIDLYNQRVTKRITECSESIVNNTGVKFTVSQKDSDKHDSQLTINQSISPNTDVFLTVQETLKYIKK